jgi:uncharacterized protein YyaL (SSP411 family)
MKADAVKFPTEHYNWLNLMMNYTQTHYEVAVSGKDAETKINTLQNNFLPNVLIAGATQESHLPIMENRFTTNHTYIYICIEGSCKLPETDVTIAVSKLKR